MTEQTINELTNFFQKFGKEEAKQPAQSNLLFDDENKKYLGIFNIGIPKKLSI